MIYIIYIYIFEFHLTLLLFGFQRQNLIIGGSHAGPTHMPAPIRARAPPLHMGFGDDPDDNLYGGGHSHRPWS